MERNNLITNNELQKYHDDICKMADKLMRMECKEALQYFSVFMQGKLASAGVEV